MPSCASLHSKAATRFEVQYDFSSLDEWSGLLQRPIHRRTLTMRVFRMVLAELLAYHSPIHASGDQVGVLAEVRPMVARGFPLSPVGKMHLTVDFFY